MANLPSPRLAHGDAWGQPVPRGTGLKNPSCGPLPAVFDVGTGLSHRAFGTGHGCRSRPQDGPSRPIVDQTPGRGAKLWTMRRLLQHLSNRRTAEAQIYAMQALHRHLVLDLQ